MERHYQLKVTSDTTNIDVDSIDAVEVARIVQLAGISARPSQPMAMPPAPAVPAMGDVDMGMPVDGASMPDDTGMDMGMDNAAVPMPGDRPMMEQTCSVCGAADHDESECPDMFSATPAAIREMQAEYDYGNEEQEPEEVDVNTYVYSQERLPQHFGKIGDNTLENPLKAGHIKEDADRIFSVLSRAYRSYIAEDRENEDGSLSPLSDPDVPDFDKDPLFGKEPVDDGSHSPFSTVVRQEAKK